MYRLLFIALILLNITLCGFSQTVIKSADGQQVTITDISRIITIGSSITETMFALGAGDQVIAVDQSSSYPQEVHQLPKVPYIRSMSAEGVLALNPSLIISNEDVKPKTVINQIRSAGVPVLLIQDKPTFDGAVSKINIIGQAVGRQKHADSLTVQISKDLALAKKQRAQVSETPEVMFLLSAGRSQHTLMAAGVGTSAEAMIELAAGKNVFKKFEGYKPVSSEAVAAANPEVILMMSSREHQVAGEKGLKAMPGIRLTDAAKNNRLVTMDGNFLLGFGPRLGKAVLELMNHLHSERSIKP